MSEKNKLSNKFFLISFLPAITYWYLESYYPVKIAVAGGLCLAILELILERIFTKHIHSLSKFNFYLILILGGVSLISDEGIWFKLQPFFTGLGIGGFLFFKLVTGKGLLYEMMESLGKNVPPYQLWRTVEIHLAALFLIFAFFMGGLALYASTDLWVFFKTIGFYIVFMLFMVLEMIVLRVRIRKIGEKQQVMAYIKRIKNSQQSLQ